MNEEAEQYMFHKLYGSLLNNACSYLAKDDQDFHFSSSDASGQSVYRFSTSISEQVFGKAAKDNGPWNNGKNAMYEILNNPDGIIVRFCIGSNFFIDSWMEDFSSILVGKAVSDDDRGILSIATWRLKELYPEEGVDVAVKRFVKEELPKYQEKLLVWQKERKNALEEGSIHNVVSDRYERNPIARKKCIEIHGCRCAICGFDFKKAYGDEFEGIIQVHHIVPLSNIKESHIVDPAKDLIPVCPNCHVALHSKPGGVYLPEELKALLSKQNN